jgi:uncharacterized small protein (DUF1192 family)
MAKALLGHIGGPDPRLMSEVQRLRRRVTDLEDEIRRLQADNDHLSAIATTTFDLDDAVVREPALT